MCKGARLSQEVLKCKIDGYNIAELASLEVGQLIGVIKTIKEPKATPILKILIQRLQYLADIGLEYLTLNRETDTLSGGESQRVKIVKHRAEPGGCDVRIRRAQRGSSPARCASFE